MWTLKNVGKVRGNPKTMRSFGLVGTHSPAIHAYYSSYASAAIREEKRSHTVFKSARVAIGIGGRSVCHWSHGFWRPWSSLKVRAFSDCCRWINGYPNHDHRTRFRFGESAEPIGNVSFASDSPATKATSSHLGGAGMSATGRWRYLLDSGERSDGGADGRYGLMVSKCMKMADGSLAKEVLWTLPAIEATDLFHGDLLARRLLPSDRLSSHSASDHRGA